MNNIANCHAGDGFGGSNRPSGRYNFWADAIDGELLDTVCREPDGLIHIYRYGFLDDADPELVLIEQQPAASEGVQHPRA